MYKKPVFLSILLLCPIMLHTYTESEAKKPSNYESGLPPKFCSVNVDRLMAALLGSGLSCACSVCVCVCVCASDICAAFLATELTFCNGSY